ncbi:hypothetical protein [Brenneria tiliae]|uniref:hypothetical protein n=1 Tax=Brenneria tiliae TaxID=2914984 RepID=UPI002014EBC8|nr:hypothetical protein [Brenneria tiliae]MCL2898546.1 hypothetical protein [Brenneria tiliae]MCL2902911.1 hypothetical protein [Brenneria tiliae]
MSQTYLQLQMQSNKKLAMALTKTLKDIHSNLMTTIYNVKSGSQRLVNYGSCLMPDEYYRSSCRNMWREDTRLVMALGEIYHRNDVVLDMVEIYFRKVLTRIGPQGVENISSQIERLLGKAAAYSSGKASKLALSITIAKIIMSSRDFNESHVKMVNNFASWFVTGTNLYAKAQVAASAARKLQYQDADYYQTLYKENIEMLYFLIEPYMSKIIYQVKSGDNNEEKIMDALYEILKK